MKDELFNNSNSRVQEQEKVKNTNREIKAQCKQLKSQCDAFEAEILRLNDKMKKMTEEVSFM